jgi:hypothetical protein
MLSMDQQIRNIHHHAQEAFGNVIREDGLKCPHKGCWCIASTHVIDVVWERDPSEGDRRWVRLEVRCEAGHGYFLLLRNHAGTTRLEYQPIVGELSPFAEGVRW